MPNALRIAAPFVHSDSYPLALEPVARPAGPYCHNCERCGEPPTLGSHIWVTCYATLVCERCVRRPLLDSLYARTGSCHAHLATTELIAAYNARCLD